MNKENTFDKQLWDEAQKIIDAASVLQSLFRVDDEGFLHDVRIKNLIGDQKELIRTSLETIELRLALKVPGCL